MLLLGGLVFLVAVVANSASPTNLTDVGASCTITKFNQVSSVLNSCTNVVVKNLVVDAGQTLKLFLKAGATLTFEGTTTFAYAEWKGPLIWIKGNGITVIGAQGHKLDGRGEKWWDGKGDGGKVKPQFMFIQATGGSVLKNINMYNCPHQCVGISDSDHVTISNWQLDSSAGNPVNGKEVGHNTDGFDLYKSNYILLDGIVVRNQDDCICINGGSHLTFRNLWCYGGHGLSISSGMSMTDYNLNVVSDVHFEHCHVSDSRNGIHIKTIADGGKGKMSGLYFSDIQLSGISTYGINVEQNYRNNGGPSGKPNNNVPIDTLEINGVTGTLNGPWSVKAYILCASGACKNFKWSNINLQGNSRPDSCNFHPSGYNC
uniref:endo-polygalacturonase n=1 Tax=Leptinotarsa decemlineata TaxID=7539 RepID=E7CJ01_LEPDE|nr:endopolygalacturonase [Leptinotarsa decemlineata]